MKKYITISEVKPTNTVLRLNLTLVHEEGLQEILKEYLKPNSLYTKIEITFTHTIPELLLKLLTNQYLHGTEITFIKLNSNFNKTYKMNYTPPKLYQYNWTVLDFTKPIPSKLANYKFKYNGKETTYLEAIKSLKTTRYIPNEIWKAIDEYSKERIKKCKEYNKGDYELAELLYKDLTKNGFKHNFKVYSPNQKTLYEATAEYQFEKDCKEYTAPTKPLTERQLISLRKWAPIYDIEIPTFKWHYNSRKTEHGYTQEPEVCICGMSTTDWTRATFDARNEDNLPKFVRNGLVIKETENNKLLRDTYIQLLWLRRYAKDNALAPQYHRCPICHKIYHEKDGCPCGHCQPVPEIELYDENTYIDEFDCLD